MKPDVSQWREGKSYDYFDGLSVEGLTWECLRRNEGYQELYSALVDDDTEAAPLPREAELRWGLRFRGEAWAARAGTGCSVVSARRSGHRHADNGSRILRPSLHSREPRHRRASR
ncbi:DUF6499 domain-containing protein [Mesorhizobium sp. BR1-1-16]|nr:DUF6499 domain-containing protein [Mesorhizobium sp. BR1-1-16]MBZ9937033.1 DUF6499 domain-containing protein [Mesorhizobium sp. BR1-1-16]